VTFTKSQDAYDMHCTSILTRGKRAKLEADIEVPVSF